MFKYELATSLTLNIEKYCYSYLSGLADLWCLRSRCLPITTYLTFYLNDIMIPDILKQVVEGEQFMF